MHLPDGENLTRDGTPGVKERPRRIKRSHADCWRAQRTPCFCTHLTEGEGDI